MKYFRFVIAGDGYDVSVIARCLADYYVNDQILIIDSKNHIGGHSYDKFNEHGILVHQYGPHIFHTKHTEVFNFLSRFTSWIDYEHRVLAFVDGKLLPIPINRVTINKYFGLNLSNDEVSAFLESIAEKKEIICNSEDAIVSKIGRELYEKFFKFYSLKQWDKDPSELDAAILSRIPVRTNNDDRYFSDPYQVMPSEGYTKMFERMLDHPNIQILLQTDYFDIKDQLKPELTIYTGPIDRFFDYKYGHLQYRSLRFEWQTFDKEFFQPVAVVNYPNNYDFTRITEYKRLTGQTLSKTTISREFPTWNGDPYYPVATQTNKEMYEKYRLEVEKLQNVLFLGRLAEYKYFNMDQVVLQTLTLFQNRIQKNYAL